VTPLLYVISIVAAGLILLLVWSFRQPRPGRKNLWPLEDHPRSNVQYFPQIQQAMDSRDREFLQRRGGLALARVVERERRKVAREFLHGLDEEFNRLLRLARIIASLSPEVVTLEELERVRLTVLFRWRLQVIYLRLALGAAPVVEAQTVSDMISRLTVRMESAMRELGERASLAMELASTLDGDDLHAA
jgi:hypothetical protein